MLAFAGYLIGKNGLLELVIEDGCLRWTDELQEQCGHVVIAQIAAVRLVNTNSDDYEGLCLPDVFVVLQDGTQVRVPRNVIPSVPRLTKALRRLNANIAVIEQDASERCHWPKST